MVCSNMLQDTLIWLLKKTLWSLFMDGGSTTPRLEPLWGGSLLFTTKFSEIPGTHFMDLRRMKNWVDLVANQWFWTWDPLDWESSTLTTRPLLYFCKEEKRMKRSKKSWKKGLQKNYTWAFATSSPTKHLA